MDTISRLFSCLPKHLPSTYLATRIMKRIDVLERRRQHAFCAYSLVLFFISLAAFTLVLPSTVEEITGSEFFAMLSLLISDPDILIAGNSFYTPALLETFPLTSSISLSFTIFAVCALTLMSKQFIRSKKIL